MLVSGPLISTQVFSFDAFVVAGAFAVIRLPQFTAII